MQTIWTGCVATWSCLFANWYFCTLCSPPLWEKLIYLFFSLLFLLREKHIPTYCFCYGNSKGPMSIYVQEKYIDIARSLIIKADPLLHFQQSLSLAIGKIKTIGLNAPQTTHSLCDHFPPGNCPLKCINAPTVPRLGRIEIQGGNLTLEPCGKINSTVTRTRSKAYINMQDAGCMNCLFHFRIVSIQGEGRLHGGQI